MIDDVIGVETNEGACNDNDNDCMPWSSGTCTTVLALALLVLLVLTGPGLDVGRKALVT